MSLKVPYLPDKAIEAEADALLAEYARAQRKAVSVPVPVEEILENHLHLHLGFDDLCAKLGRSDVLGEIRIDEREVLIDQSLNPDDHPAMLGRYRFTLAHEVGHWRLHRRHYELWRQQQDLFAPSPAPPIICRTSQQKKPVEIQADAFAGCLLMPRSEVIGHWHHRMGLEPLDLSRLHADEVRLAQAAFRCGRIRVDEREQDDDMIELTILPLAKVFEVSPQAMRIRLEQLGLVVREVTETVSLFGAM